ncbi:hypothetical protein HOLDEFILI_03999 [Holdemania filiformis DSM 12042]|uniref:Uncharacterized protein n=1 Tax=Holdemania filiformis DSM 12042 TaxID=545696 RepID=B9YDS5_9FIRM|nr:hypothetical protein HOLDEFILI_03999 [Holdemania filiformis DSM 12042]
MSIFFPINSDLFYLISHFFFFLFIFLETYYILISMESKRFFQDLPAFLFHFTHAVVSPPWIWLAEN